MIQSNSKRQRRIIASSAATVANGGFLAYMTCTFSREENEEVLEWFLKVNPEFETVQVPALSTYQSPYTTLYSYRMWPFNGEGSGAFTALLQRKGEHRAQDPQHIKEKISALRIIWGSEPAYTLESSHRRKGEGRDRRNVRDDRASRRRYKKR